MKKGKCVRQAAALVLASVMAMSLAACGKSDSGNTQGTTETKEYIYVPEYLELDSSSNSSYNNMTLQGDKLYYMNYQWDDATGTSTIKLGTYDMNSGEKASIPIDLDTENGGINSMQVDADGNLYTAEYSWNSTEGDDAYSQQKTILSKYDASGAELMSQDITDILSQDENNSYINSMCIDNQGRFYITSESIVRLFDAEGQFQGTITPDNCQWMRGLGTTNDGRVFLVYYNDNGESQLSEIDFDGKKMGQSYENFPESNMNGTLGQGPNGGLLINSDSVLYEYNLQDQTTTEVLTWLDSDINGNYVSYTGVTADGRILAVVNDWNSGETDIVKLTKTKSSEVPQKTQVTIGTLYTSQSLQTAAVAFNKQSTQYHISIKTYIDENNWTETSWSDGITAMNNAITSGSNCPDILDLSNMDIASLMSKGAIEDMMPYLEKSTVLDKDDFFENILTSYTFDGKLAGIPKSFSLSTVVGKTSELGDKNGWTLDDIISYSKEHEGANLFDGMTKSNMLYYLLAYDLDSYIDRETGKCSFDSENFQKVLEFVNTFPEEYDWQNDDRSTPAKIQAGDVLLNMTAIYELNGIQEQEAMFGEPVTYIGYPTSDGSNGTYMGSNELYAIASKSANKDGAWAFIENYLEIPQDDMLSYGLPARKSQLDAEIEEQTNVTYLTDEQGALILDENGDPIPQGGTSSIGYGDWEYTYHIPTDAEIETLKNLISIAKPMSTSSDDEVTNIITEEAEAFFKGQKSVADVANIIQSRVQVYVNENR